MSNRTAYQGFAKRFAAERPKPEGRYSTVYATDASIDDWDEITSVESPTAIASERPANRKRSGDWLKADFAAAMTGSKSE